MENSSKREVNMGNNRIVTIFLNSVNGVRGGDIEAKKMFLAIYCLSKEFKYTLYNYSTDKTVKGNTVKHTMINKTFIKDIFSRIFKHSTFFYFDWQKNRKNILFEIKPSIIILGSSRLGFVINDIKKYLPETQIITQYQNVECDTVKIYSKEYSGIKKKIFEFLELSALKKDENISYMNSNFNVFLSNRDFMRMNEIYGKNTNINKIIPICIEEYDNNLKFSNKYKCNFIFLGSLDYLSNSESIEWFLKNVWNKLDVFNLDINLIIGGKNPNLQLVEKIERSNNVVLYKNFKSKIDIIPKNSIFISPIKNGAGMKVKIAEALSMGLSVIGTTESFIGYEEVLDLNRDYLIEINEAEKFKSLILNISKDGFKNNEANLKELFRNFYTLERAKKEIHSLFINNVMTKGRVK